MFSRKKAEKGGVVPDVIMGLFHSARGGAGRMAVKFCALKASPHELGAVVMQARCRRLDPSPRWTSLLVFSLAYKLESVLNFDTMSNFAIEAIVAAVYVACFGVTIHGWQAAEAYAVST